jgi:hypothetical protein
VFVGYQQVENHVLNPLVMSRTVKVNPLLVLVSVLIGTSIGGWLGGFLGSFVAALLSIPAAGALQVIGRELWQATALGGQLADEPGPPGLPMPVARCGLWISWMRCLTAVRSVLPWSQRPAVTPGPRW